MAVAHFAVQFRLRDQRGHRIHHQHVNSARAYQSFRDLQRLLAVIGLGDQQVVHVNAQLGGVDGIEGVLGVHEGCHATLLLRLGNDLQGDGGLAGGFRPEDFHHTPAREATDAECGIKGNRSRRNHGDGNNRSLASQLHDGALAELLFDLRHGQVDGPAFFSSLVCHKCHSLRAPRRHTWVSGRAIRYELRLVSEAGAAAEWVFFGERRMITDAALYIPLTNKSEEIANMNISAKASLGVQQRGNLFQHDQAAETLEAHAQCSSWWPDVKLRKYMYHRTSQPVVTWVEGSS